MALQTTSPASANGNPKAIETLTNHRAHPRHLTTKKVMSEDMTS